MPPHRSTGVASKKPRTVNSVPASATGSQASGNNACAFKSPITTISTGGFGYNDGNSTVGDEQAHQHRSTPGLVWCLNRDAKSGSVDQTAINAVVTMTVFPKVKFVVRETELSYSADKQTIS